MTDPFNQQVIVIAHQHIGMNAYSEPIGCLRQQLQEVRPVGVLPVDELSFVAASGDMKAAARAIDA